MALRSVFALAWPYVSPTCLARRALPGEPIMEFYPWPGQAFSFARRTPWSGLMFSSWARQVFFSGRGGSPNGFLLTQPNVLLLVLPGVFSFAWPGVFFLAWPGMLLRGTSFGRSCTPTAVKASVTDCRSTRTLGPTNQVFDWPAQAQIRVLVGQRWPAHAGI